jgi:hypothetical protein
LLFSGEGSLDAAFSHTTRRECIGRVQPPDWSFNNTWKALQYPLLKRDMSPLWQARRLLSRLRTPGLCYRCEQVHGLEQVSEFLFSFRRKSCSKQQEKAVEKREPRQLRIQWARSPGSTERRCSSLGRDRSMPRFRIRLGGSASAVCSRQTGASITHGKRYSTRC